MASSATFHFPAASGQDRVASRNFDYLLPFLAFFGRLSWLVSATAIRVNAFFHGLTFYVLRTRR